MGSSNRNQIRPHSPRFLLAVSLFLLTFLQWNAVQAEERRSALVGELWYTDQTPIVPYQNAFRLGLRELGYIEGKNLTIVVRYADGDATRVPELAAELVSMNVDVLFVSIRTLDAVKRLTTTIPIVCAGFGDPVSEGHVSSLARPGGNITGLSWQSPDASGKRLELILEVIPGLRQVAQLFEATDRTAFVEASAGRKAAESAGVKVRAYAIRDLTELDTAFDAMKKQLPQALLVTHTPFTVQHRDRIMGFARTHKIPVVSEARDFAEAGALLTYGPYPYDIFKRAATYVDRILRGATPGALPIEQAASFELVVNLRTARVLGLTIPQSVRLRASEVLR